MYIGIQIGFLKPQQWPDLLQPLLKEGEQILGICAITNMLTEKVNGLVITNVRLGRFNSTELKQGKGIVDYVTLNEIVDIESETKKLARTSHKVTINCTNGDIYEVGTLNESDLKEFKKIIDNPSSGDSNILDQLEKDQDLIIENEAAWDKLPASISWGSFPKPIKKQLIANSNFGEVPKFAIVAGDKIINAGALAAYSDRCLIVKTGLVAGFMAGSLGGSRISTFYYSEITGIEYNTGILSGVLEILTASYDGSANKDFWQGTLSGRNSNSNDPWTLSNTLPLDKIQYKNSKKYIDELRELIRKGKQTNVTVEVKSSGKEHDFTEQLERLSELKKKGVITEAEFKKSKKKLLDS
jgi:Short C-terminal domain